MTQSSVTQELSNTPHGDEQQHGKNMLGPLLCWAVVFADIGTSVYYTPGILYTTVGSLAGFFVFLTMSVFVLLTLKYAEITHRFPQGGGVVTVAAQAMNRWAGALGGMFILVDYFLTAAISCLSGMIYLSIVLPAMAPFALWITIGVLVLLGMLNWVGISESARVSLIGAIIAFVSDLAILYTIFTHISFTTFLSLFAKMFEGHALTPSALLVGFAGSFLAFSGLESISQLSPVMKQPHKKIAGIALFLVVLTIGLTSPLLTMFSTILLPHEANDPVLSGQLISLLAGYKGGIFLQTEVAISASALLVFASNTAIIGSYHVFLALSRMEFLPGFILQRNKMRGTPHYSIALATGIPIVILVAVFGNINILGDMYAFGLLGAFTLTCLGLDIVRFRDWRAVWRAKRLGTISSNEQATLSDRILEAGDMSANETGSIGNREVETPSTNRTGSIGNRKEEKAEKSLWFKIDFLLGVLTTLLVAVAWCTNLATKPLATGFGGGVTVLGMAIAYANYVGHQRKGHVPVPMVVTRVEGRIPDSILAVLTANNGHNSGVIRAAVNNAAEQVQKRPIVFLYIGERPTNPTVPRMMEIIDPYLDDPHAKEYFGQAESLAIEAKIPMRRFIYLEEEPDVVAHVWQVVRPHDTVIAAGNNERLNDINPDRIRYEITADGKVAHLLKRW